MSTVRVSKKTKELLFRYAAKLQLRLGRKVDLDEAIRHLLRSEAKLNVLDDLFGSVPELSVQELLKERKLDEARANRRYGL